MTLKSLKNNIKENFCSYCIAFPGRNKKCIRAKTRVDINSPICWKFTDARNISFSKTFTKVHY